MEQTYTHLLPYETRVSIDLVGGHSHCAAKDDH